MADVLDPAEAERLDEVAPDEGPRRREFLERTARAAGVGLAERGKTLGWLANQRVACPPRDRTEAG